MTSMPTLRSEPTTNTTTGYQLSRRSLLRGAVAVGALAALGACTRIGGGTGGNGGGGLSGRTIRVATFPNNHVAGVLFWQQFAPEGVTVEVTTLPSGSEMNTALDRGDLDFATFGVVNGFVQAAEGLRTKIIGMAARQGAGLVVRNEAPYASVEDLVGARIGINEPSFQSLLWSTLLDDAGLDIERDVEIIPLGWNDMPLALQSGDVDAYMGTEPNPSRSVAEGVGRRLINPYTTPVGQLNSALWASPNVLDDAELCRAAVDMQRQAANYLSPGGTNDPAVWEDLVVGQFGLEPGVYRELVANVGSVWELNDFWVAQARAAGDMMARLGILDEAPDYDEVLTTEFQPVPA